MFVFSAKCSDVTDVHLNPIKVLHVVEEVLSDDAILVADGGDFVATAAYILRFVSLSTLQIKEHEFNSETVKK